MNVSERVRLRLKEAMQDRGISQRELADLLSAHTAEVWTQSRVQKVLTGYVELKVEDVDAIANVCGITLCEAVRDPGMEFYAEMTPTELRLFQRLKRRPDALDAVMILLHMPRPQAEDKETVELPPKPKRGRPLNSSLPPDATGPSDETVTKGAKTGHTRSRPK